MFPSFPLLDANGNADRRDVGAKRRRLLLEHVLAAHRRELPPGRRGPSIVKAHFGRYYKELEAGEFRPAVPSITPAYRVRLRRRGQPRQLRADLEQRQPADRLGHEGAVLRSVHGAVRAGADAEPGPPGELRAQARARTTRAGATSPGSTCRCPTWTSARHRTPRARPSWSTACVSPPPAACILQTNPGGHVLRATTGATFMVTKRMSNNWQAVFSLVLSEVRRPARARARARLPTTTQSSQAGTFGRELPGRTTS